MLRIEMPSKLREIIGEFSQLHQVEAIVLSGSKTAKISDNFSDYDIYVYHNNEIPIETRRKILSKYAEELNIDNRFWELGDDLILNNENTIVDIMYRTPSWIEERIDNLLAKHIASIGYSTCFLHNVINSTAIYEKSNWYETLQKNASNNYPEQLRYNILRKNHPILSDSLCSYKHQIELAIKRGDYISVNHRVAALLESYFDIIFAVNYIPHTGEKKIIKYIKTLCQKYPDNFDKQIDSLLDSISPLKKGDGIIENIDELIGSLNNLLIKEQLI